jgi:glyoxylase-like metal-dependent hydrolase (beta-lactamase superfamily II)/rhodanese-related sulfurtransferase
MTRTSIDVESLRQMLEQGEPVTVLDVRPEDQSSEWWIPGRVQFAAYRALKANDPDAMKEVELPEGQPVVTVCAAGSTSAIAAEHLRDRGLEAYTLEGGMKAWNMAWNTAEVSVAGTDARVIQVRRTGKGCLSYLVGSGGEAAVIDASLDPEVYIELAKERGWKIARVLDTHVHADHLSRSRGLAELVGATLHMPEGVPLSYPFSALGEGETLEVGTARLEAVRTPGHTPESMSYLLDGGELFTGDTLFIESVGRPDLGSSPVEAREKARSLHASLRRLLKMEPETLVLPGHTGSPVPFDGEPVAGTLADVREGVSLLRESEEAFIERIAGIAQPPPENHARIVAFNRTGELPEDDVTELEAGANRCAVG